MTEYYVVFEPDDSREEPWGAWVPDLPGCVTTGATLDKCRDNIREAISLHLACMRADGEIPPLPSARGERVAVAA
jgi:predicted RNase H-like HicB family nuclease